MTEWRKYYFKDIFQIIDGDRGVNYPKQSDLYSEGFCLFLNTGNVTSSGFNFEKNQFITKEKDKMLRKGKLRRGDIVFTTRGTVGNVALYDDSIPYENIRINSGMVILRTNESVANKEFIFQILKSNYKKKLISPFISGSVQPQLPIKDLKEISLPLPPLPEQKAIAEVLSSLDDKIDLLTRQNKTLEDLAQAYFRKWFIEDASNKWEKKSLGEIVTINYGKALPERERVSGKIPVYSSAGVTGWHNQYLVNSRGIVIGRKGTIGTIYWVPEPFYCIDTAYYITPEDSKYDLTFIYFLLKTMSLQDLNEDSAVPGLNRNTIYSQEFLQPPDDLICKFIRLSNTLLQKIQSNTAQIHALSKLRDTLLPKLISGEIRVKM